MLNNHDNNFSRLKDFEALLVPFLFKIQCSAEIYPCYPGLACLFIFLQRFQTVGLHSIVNSLNILQILTILVYSS